MFDVDGYREIDGWRLGPADQFFESVAFLTNNWPSLGIGLASFIAVLHRRRTKPALSLLIVGTVVEAIALTADIALGEFVGRARPDGGSASYPSGHAFGTTAFYGFLVYLANRHGLRRAMMVPPVLCSCVLTVFSGISRIHEDAQWPTDVIAGHLLGLAVPIVLVLAHSRISAAERTGPSRVEL